MIKDQADISDIAIYKGEIIFSGNTFTLPINDSFQLKKQIQEKISELSDWKEWYFQEVSEEERRQGMYWKMVYKKNNKNTAIIRSVPGNFKK